jgi:hypothetical protein
MHLVKGEDPLVNASGALWLHAHFTQYLMFAHAHVQIDLHFVSFGIHEGVVSPARIHDSAS